MKKVIIFILLIFTLISCGSDGDTKTIGILSVSNDRRVLDKKESIIVVFDRSFEGSYSFEGDLGPQVQATLNTTNVQNDTLELAPITTWSSGNSLSLIINVNSSVGTARQIVLEEFEILP